MTNTLIRRHESRITSSARIGKTDGRILPGKAQALGGQQHRPSPESHSGVSRISTRRDNQAVSTPVPLQVGRDRPRLTDAEVAIAVGTGKNQNTFIGTSMSVFTWRRKFGHPRL